MEYWKYWTIAGIILFAVEIYTPGFVLASFGIACMCSGFAAVFSFSPEVQLIVFAVAAIFVFVTIRPFVQKFLYTGEKLATGTSALIGKTGKVEEKICNEDNVGRVMVGGESWKACSDNGQIIEANEIVEIKGISGVTLKVIKNNLRN